MKAVYIYEGNQMSFYKRIFLKRYCRECKKEMQFCDITFLAYGFSIFQIEKNERNIEKLVEFLKEEEITHILLSDNLYSHEKIYQQLKKYFNIVNGNNVINYKLLDILRRCAVNNNLELEKSTLVIITDYPQKAKKVILNLYRHVKRIRIKTDKKEEFAELSEEFMNEYGLFIEMSDKKSQENELSVLLDEKEKELFDINASENSLNNHKLICKSNKISKVNSPFPIFHQAVIEFLVLQKYGSFSFEAVGRFFKNYHVRIVNFKNSD